MKRRKPQLSSKRRVVSHVPMAPMFDMVFLLLVFFMCVSSLSQAGHRIELDLPESTSSETPKDLSNRLLLSVRQDGTLYLGGTPIDEARLPCRLKSLVMDFPDLKLRIRADRQTAFEDIKSVMAAASEAGISDYIYGAFHGE